MKTARECLSTRVVAVFLDQRLIDVVGAVVRQDALYCAVVSREGDFVGLVRLKEIVLRSTERIFADLVSGSPPAAIDEKTPAQAIVKQLRAERCDELVVLSAGKKYVGLVTRESLFDWWAREENNPARS